MRKSIFSILLEVLSVHALLKLRYFKNLLVPWLSGEIRMSVQDRDRARRIWRKNGYDEDYRHYKILRNRIQILVQSTKRDYYLNTFSNANRANKVWSHLKYFELI